MKIIDNSVTEIKSGEEIALDGGHSSLTFQYTGGDTVAVTGTVDGESYAAVAAVKLGDYSTATGALGEGIYRLMAVGGIVKLKFTFESGSVTASAE